MTAALALLSGWLASLGFAPASLWWASLLGSAGLALLLMQGRRPFLIGWLWGLAHFTFGLRWIAHAFTFQTAMPEWLGHVAVVGLSAYLALFPAVAALLAVRLARGTPLALVLLLPATFIATEIARGFVFTGFPWNPLGGALLPLPPLAGLAATWGAPGLSGLVILGGATLALPAGAAARARAPVPLAQALVPLALGGGVVALALALAPPLPAGPPADGPLFLLVQPNASQADKHGPDGGIRHLATHLDLTARELSRLAPAARARLAAVIWPEGAIEYALEEDPGLRRLVTQALPPGAWLLAGGVAVERDAAGDATAVRNSLFALDSTGRVGNRYDKAHLVPGGEYLPLRPFSEWLGLARLVPGSLDFLPGPGPRTIRLPGLPAYGASICYEIIFPGAVVERGQRPDFLLTVSSDAWFGPSGPPQHFDQARLRAIEEGLPILRVTPTGISGVIDADGRVRATIAPGRAGAILTGLPAARALTPFAGLGLVLPLLLAALLALAGLLAARGKT
jgi:apolipoprotein N-acyltransferase